jgi:peptide/nickel transport system permease protein
MIRRLGGDWRLLLGGGLLIVILGAAAIGPLLIDTEATQPTYGRFNAEPSAQHWLGTDNIGRDLFALLIYGLWPTISIGLIASAISTGLGTTLGLISGYVGGWVDVVIRIFSDVVLTIPVLIMLALITSFTQEVSIEGTALIVGLLAWAGPTRAIRAQALSIRERGYVKVARMNHLSNLRIIFSEMMPNLMPYIVALFISQIAAGILASVGLQLLGIGPLLTPNIGLTLSSSFSSGAMVRGAWWWWGPPVVVLSLLFFATFLVSLVLDEVANPRLRGSV